jgi:hypothetical protein
VRHEPSPMMDEPSPMMAWTGVLVAPVENGDAIDDALSQLQAELDEHGRAAQYRIELETAEDGLVDGHGTLTAEGRARITAWVGVLVGVLAPIAVLESRWPALGLAATLAFVLAGSGAGITCWLNIGDSYVQAALTMVLSAAAFALAAVGMIWLTDWHPRWLLCLAVPSVLSCLYRLYRLRRGRMRLHEPSLSRST